ncbi:ferredoxin [candidate division WOR-1 bacterium RIFOXYC2_FULL_37_10]|uniref:Ferredoxin n=1 Tax=candidate division WOR-1 bacterium RIFOXYB2_FULL_37_13 TaxID=1802579 RepID=A0A1F4SVH8_UNCSA|nr:MAG: ferredoxin [candidate division WOR-1 bacterium RIFOXYA2_FULL_37_7]OGC24445.1 MAG: ferredoxin [candidate division WOR-1 bacterium RIFOXYB2_FULL_37_13]OGC35543.1 MAG: ferredoxin [candidate division WOR-1 bacterium RIFOXYC2_FULL_37_10]
MAEKAVVDPNVCTGCSICIDSCPSEAIKMADNVAKVDPEKCTSCSVCVDACPVQAISMK